MEDWFLANKIPEEKKTTSAEETLVKVAYMIWDMDVSIRDEYHELAATWEEMKQLLSEEFVRDDNDNIENDTLSNHYAYPRPSLSILAPKPGPSITFVVRHSLHWLLPLTTILRRLQPCLCEFSRSQAPFVRC